MWKFEGLIFGLPVGNFVFLFFFSKEYKEKSKKYLEGNKEIIVTQF